MKRTVLAIAGMKSNACRERVAEVLAQLTGVLEVNVSLMRGHAVVMHDTGCSSEALVAAVIGAGFSAEHVSANG